MRFAISCLALAVVGILVVGCKTTPKVDWNSRIGHYTFDQAITELGPPDKTAKLSDGRTVAEWVTGQTGGSAFSVGTGVFGGHGGMSVGQTVGSAPQPRILRLTFGTDNVLQAVSGTR